MLSDEFEPDEEGESQIKEEREYECYGCGNTLDRDHESYLKSRRFFIFKRYRCKKCGERHERLGRKESCESWVIPSKKERL